MNGMRDSLPDATPGCPSPQLHCHGDWTLLLLRAHRPAAVGAGERTDSEKAPRGGGSLSAQWPHSSPTVHCLCINDPPCSGPLSFLHSLLAGPHPG